MDVEKIQKMLNDFAKKKRLGKFHSLKTWQYQLILNHQNY